MSQNRIFDDLGRLMNEAAGVADGVRREIETVVRSQMERFVADMDLVKREDFDALRELVQRQSSEIADLKAQLDAKSPRKSTAKAGGAKSSASKPSSGRSGKTSK